VRIGRVRVGQSVRLARFDRDGAYLLNQESEHPSADALREALSRNEDLARSGTYVDGDEFELLAPIVNPSKFICIGLNYATHAAEAGLDVPEFPVMFAKFANTIIGPSDAIRFRTEDTSQVDFEAELGVVIGSLCSRVSEESALDYVFGYTVVNDVSARDAQFADGQWVRGKSFDGFAPIGPVIVTRDEIADVQNLSICCTLNGTQMQSASTSDMVFGVAQIVSYVSRFITLIPGDLIATGTPAGIGCTRTPQVLLGNDDVLETEIEDIGRLVNVVVAL